MKQNSKQIRRTLNGFSNLILLKWMKCAQLWGASVTLYEVYIPCAKLYMVQKLKKDIALCFGIKGIRVLAPIPGNITVGIEIPNRNPHPVSLRSVLNSPEFENSKAALPVVLGRTTTNEIFIFDLDEVSNLLVASFFRF